MLRVMRVAVTGECKFFFELLVESEERGLL